MSSQHRGRTSRLGRAGLAASRSIDTPAIRRCTPVFLSQVAWRARTGGSWDTHRAYCSGTEQQPAEHLTPRSAHLPSPISHRTPHTSHLTSRPPLRVARQATARTGRQRAPACRVLAVCRLLAGSVSASPIRRHRRQCSASRAPVQRPRASHRQPQPQPARTAARTSTDATKKRARTAAGASRPPARDTPTPMSRLPLPHGPNGSRARDAAVPIRPLFATWGRPSGMAGRGTARLRPDQNPLLCQIGCSIPRLLCLHAFTRVGATLGSDLRPPPASVLTDLDCQPTSSSSRRPCPLLRPSPCHACCRCQEGLSLCGSQSRDLMPRYRLASHLSRSTARNVCSARPSETPPIHIPNHPAVCAN